MATPGRPLKFKDLPTLKRKIDKYFANCDPHWEMQEKYIKDRDEKGNEIIDGKGNIKYRRVKEPVKTKQIPYTITGLAVALGTTRETLLDYEERDEYSDTIKEAKQRCQNFAELSLFGGNATGSIFSLKNNYEWKDRQELEMSGELKRDASEEELDAIIARAEARQASKNS